MGDTREERKREKRVSQMQYVIPSILRATALEGMSDKLFKGKLNLG